MITVTHRDCGGPAVESDVLHGHESLKSAKELSIHCLTCLEEITSPEELIFGEDLLQ
jgi:hypothetical protein